jgi:RHS repeat-associated protein
MVTNGTGEVISRHDYLPFGEEIHSSLGGRDQVPGYGGSSITRRFTGKERDFESGLDYFGARYLSPAQGRFTTADRSEGPQPIPYANLNDPQSFNLYAYVHNSPLIYTDPDGRRPEWVGGLFGAAVVAGFEAHRQVKSGRSMGWVERNTRLGVALVAGFVLGAGTVIVIEESSTLLGVLGGGLVLGEGVHLAQTIANGAIDGAVDVAKGGTGKVERPPKVVPTLVDGAVRGTTSVAGGAAGTGVSSEGVSALIEHAFEALGDAIVHKREEKREAQPHKEQPPKPRPSPGSSDLAGVDRVMP